MDSDARAAAWTYFGIVIGFKFITFMVILFMEFSTGALTMLMALHVPFILVGLAALGIPAIFWYRRIRARARRSQLIWEEWHVDEPAAVRSRKRS